MIQHRVTVDLDCPVEQVFAFVIDPKNLRSWQSGLVESQVLTEGPLRVGTRVREVRKMGPTQSEVQAEITVLEPNKRFATRTVTKPQVTINYTFETKGAGTRLTYEFVMQTNGLMRLLEPLIAGSIKKDSDSDFEQLRHVLGR